MREVLERGAMADFAYPPAAVANDRWLSSRRWEQHLEAAERGRSAWQLITARRSPMSNGSFHGGRLEKGSNPSLPQSLTYTSGTPSPHDLPANFPTGAARQIGRAAVEPPFLSSATSNPGLIQGPYTSSTAGQGPFKSAGLWGWDHQPSYPGNNSQGPCQGRYSPSDSMDDAVASPNLSDFSLENAVAGAQAAGGKDRMSGKPRSQRRRPSNRDEFDGPHQFLKRPPPEVIAMQERELPRLPTNLLVQEQDSVLNQVKGRLSQCAFDFVAKYQFPIPLTQDMRPIERPQDREWTEWVYLLKRLATKRRIPARVLYNGQIRQFVTILENSLEMRHAAQHQSRPLKDDRNILQLISAGIQVAKILRDAQAMVFLDRLYVSTEQRIRERVAAASAAMRFR